MLKRWDMRAYNIRLILNTYDSLVIDLESIEIPSPNYAKDYKKFLDLLL
jgi:hypothetical protein